MYKSTSRSIQHGRERDANVRHDSPGSPRRSMRGKDVQRLQLARQRNEVLTGSVSKVEASGAFVTLGTLEGFVSRHEVTAHRSLIFEVHFQELEVCFVKNKGLRMLFLAQCGQMTI